MAEGEVSVESNMAEGVSNGLTNGHMNGTSEHKESKSEHKSSSSSSHKSKDRDREKDRHRDKDKDRHKSSHKDKDRDKERSKDKDRHNSSHSSSHKSSHRDKDKERSDKDKERSDKDKERSDKDKERRDKDKERSNKDKDKHSSSHKSSHRDKDKERSDKDKPRDKERSEKDKERSEKDKDRHKERSDKDKDRHRDKDKDKESSKDIDKERSKDKDKERSKDKDKERSKDKDKERSKDKDKERSKDKDKERSKDKDRKSSSGSHDKDRKSSSGSHDKDRKSSSSDKKDKDRHSSSHKSSHKDKHRDKDKERSKSDTKVKEEAVKSEPVENDVGVKKEPRADDSFDDFKPDVKPKVEIKAEPVTPVKKEESMFDESEDVDMKEEPQSDNEGKLVILKEEMLEEEEEEEQEEKEVEVEEEEEKEVEEEEEKEVEVEEEEEDEEEYRPEEQDEEDDDVPLASRKQPKQRVEEESDDDKPLVARAKKIPKIKKRKTMDSDAEEDDDFKPQKKKQKKKDKERSEQKKREIYANRSKSSTTSSPTKKKKKEEEEEHVWRWWEEEKRDDGLRWSFLEHKGPLIADPYEPLPADIAFSYDGKTIRLSQDAEEIAGFYARMLEHDYTTKEVFNKNFFRDWRKSMTEKEKEKIVDLKKCNFKMMYTYFMKCSEERKQRTKEEKKVLREKNEGLVKEYGWCDIDGHKQRIGNFRIEPPGLFRGRGDHPKQGMLKKRINPEDVIINCSAKSILPVAPKGHHWKEIRHDNTVSWLANWVENVQGQGKYVMLNAASKMKGEKDYAKYEIARRLHRCVGKIRDTYQGDFKSKEMRVRQRAVALYLIDKLALRAGNEKDEDQADTVGCCSLRVEHIRLEVELNGKENVVVFDFLGKDSIRYYNEVSIEKRVWKNLNLFMENKNPGDDLFDRINTQIMNQHLTSLMDGLTAKVFRTYNASRTLQEQLDKHNYDDDPLMAKVLAYNRANREVALLCNHQRAVPKTHDQAMLNMQGKLDDKKSLISDATREYKTAKHNAKHGGSMTERTLYEKKKKSLERLREQLAKLEMALTDKDENKTIALGTSKLNYLDPRISVAWCKKNDVPMEKVYNKTQRQKFQWAIDMAGPEYNFMDDPDLGVQRGARVAPPSEDEGGEEEEDE